MIEVKAKRGFSSNRLEYLYNTMKEKKFTDVTFTIGNRSFFAHMVVLSACSEFFVNNQNKLSDTFSGFEYPVIEAMLKYCYTGKINIDDKDFEQFVALGKKLQINSIDPQYKTIDQTNCLEVLRISDDPMSREQAMRLTLENFKTLYKTPGFLSLPVAILFEILKSGEINVDSEEELFKSVKLWVSSDGANRRNKLVDLLSSIKLTLLSNEFVFSEVVDFCSSYPECITILKQALQLILPNCQNTIKKESAKRNFKIALVGDNKVDVANTIDIYDGINNTWTLTKNYGINKRHFASALIGEWIMIIGGTSSNKAVTSVDYIDLKDGQKHQLKPLNLARSLFQAVTLSHDSSTDVYAIGGEANGNITSTVERWDNTTKNWETNVVPMLQAVSRHSACVIGDKIYVTGGRKKIDDKDISTDEMQMFSLKSNSWTYRAPMLFARKDHSSVAIKGKLFVGGGYNNVTFSRISSVESYDPYANLWTSYCLMPNYPYGLSLCYYRNKLICMGGYNEGYLSEVWEYDDVGQIWYPLKNLSKERSFANALLISYDSII